MPRKKITKVRNPTPSKYKPAFCKKLIEYFDVEHYTTENGVKKVNKLPFFGSFCRDIGVTKKTFYGWIKKYPKFADAHDTAKELQKEMLVSNGLLGLYKSSFAIFSAKNMIGWRDTQSVEVDGNLTVEIVKFGAKNKTSK